MILYDAQAQLMNLETALSNVELTTVNGQRLIPELIEIHREQLTSSLESARKQLADAEAAFAKFNYKASAGPAPRKYFDMHLNACVSMTAGYIRCYASRTKEARYKHVRPDPASFGALFKSCRISVRPRRLNKIAVEVCLSSCK